MSFVFVGMLLIKGDGMDFATNAFIAVGSCFNIITLTLGKTSVGNNKKGELS